MGTMNFGKVVGAWSGKKRCEGARGKAQGGECGATTLRQLSCTRQPVRVVASPRAFRLFAKFAFATDQPCFCF
ncbi:hypothetical protein WN48_05469 [Eufriesea mexicana]|uniref:Uncharacterized protein n=1 Tax=Eufriesea mexicana TaxID=516756 RepID=A0A310S9G3_9HYME|nr:hypothetical protein WN48_05469 [Eufriesea mexicana]